MARGKHWFYAKKFEGTPKESDLQLREFDIPALKNGEILIQAEFLTVDPYMAIEGMAFPGKVMVGEQVARVTESKNPKFKVGDHVVANVGWTSHAVSDGKDVTKVDIPKNLPQSLALGVLGMPGRSAYLGLMEICKPKAGETVFVTGAAGAVGAVVGQISKILGCRVVGCAGSDEKVAYLKEIGYDEAFNYKKTTDVAAFLQKAAPKGIDCYFDNVGGQMLSTVINHNMNQWGRICICGAISTYNATEEVKVTALSLGVLKKRITMTGFINYDHPDKYDAAVKQMATWIVEGKLKYKEDVTQGFDNMFKAFLGLFSGKNKGKAIIKV